MAGRMRSAARRVFGERGSRRRRYWGKAAGLAGILGATGVGRHYTLKFLNSPAGQRFTTRILRRGERVALFTRKRGRAHLAKQIAFRRQVNLTRAGLRKQRKAWTGGVE
jgi:hypothetical protein